MKRKLLFGSVAIIAFSGLFAQSGHVKKTVGIVNIAEKISKKYNIIDNEASVKASGSSVTHEPNYPAGYESKLQSTSNFTATFTRISGQENIFGALVSNSKPLDYNNELNTVTYMHRRSATYTPTNSGTMVFDIYRNMATWDSTCVWSDPANRGRYPQGGIVNPVGNTNINNAYVAGSGPVTSGSGWIGSFYTHKIIGAAGDNIAPASNMKFVPNTSPFDPVIKKVDFPRYSGAYTDDGVFRTLGTVANDVNDNTAAGYGFRGAALISGSIVAGNMVYKYDTIIPTTVMHSGGYKVCYSSPWMAWNEAGTVGYVMFIGASPTATGSNKGYQPIIFKTTNSGNSWIQVQGIDFNANANQPAYQMLLNSMNPVNTNTNLVVPYFFPGEGIDLTVDKNNNLHIVGTAIGTARQHPDSLGYIWTYSVPSNPNDNGHLWPFVPTAFPYIFDFYGDGSTGNWNLKIIDSIGTEGPDPNPANPGGSNNPWAASTNGVVSDSRIQVSRTPGGEFILFTWAESDTNLTTNNYKWNEFPNIHVRLMETNSYQVAPGEFVITSPSVGFHPRVRDKAYFHYASARSILSNTCSSSPYATVKLPIVVSNPPAYTPPAGLQPQDNFYSTATIDFCILSTPDNFVPSTINNSFAYPNPAQNTVHLVTRMNQKMNGEIHVLNIMGQEIMKINAAFEEGENTHEIPVHQLSKGIYFIKVVAGNQQVTHKLIVE